VQPKFTTLTTSELKARLAGAESKGWGGLAIMVAAVLLYFGLCG